jgi:cysteate synthase
MSHRYELVCAACDGRYPDDGLMLTCPRPHEPAFLRSRYTGGPPAVRPAEGLARFEHWLPVRRSVAGAPAPAVYRAEHLGAALGLRELWVAFSGYWPRRGAFLPTGSFKDLEASTVLGRLPADPPTLVIASAGNTAIAFGRACSERGVSCLLFVPGDILPAMAFHGELAACVKLVAIDGGAAYSDAIAVADLVSQLPGHQSEGGARNVGRRDGLGTAMLAAYDVMGRLPQWYVQAVGSGAGAIAAHEAARRILAFDPSAGELPRHLLCQNEPYTPLHDLWHDGAVAEAMPHHDSVIATELTNRTPPFAVRGGVRDTLRESRGTMTTVTNTQAREAMAMFETLEGIDIVPGAGVALAALRAAVTAGRVRVEAPVLLHVTGGGRALLVREGRLRPIEPHVRMVLPRIGIPAPSDSGAR